MDLAPPFRPATPDDAAVLATLVNMAGEGLALHLWEQMAGPGEDPWAIGAARARRETGSFSYRNAIVFADAGRVTGCLIGYPIGDTPEPTAGLPAMAVPLQELENLALGSWYVNVVAVLPEERGKGTGTRLLALARDLAAAAGCPRLSIIVSGGNAGARRLYERSGYRTIAERPIVKDGWRTDAEAWVLMLTDA